MMRPRSPIKPLFFPFILSTNSHHRNVDINHFISFTLGFASNQGVQNLFHHESIEKNKVPVDGRDIVHQQQILCPTGYLLISSCMYRHV